MIGKGVSLHSPLTYFYQSQLAMWRVVAQSCVPSIIHMEFQSRIISTIVMIGQEVLSRFGSSKAGEILLIVATKVLMNQVKILD